MKPGNGILIQIGRRFIQHKNFRAHSVDRAEGQQLLLSAGQGKDTPHQQILKMERLHRILYSTADLLRSCLLYTSHKRHDHADKRNENRDKTDRRRRKNDDKIDRRKNTDVD